MVRVADHLRTESSVPVRVLIVEDERVSRLALGTLLTRCGYRVELAESAEDALALIHRRPIADPDRCRRLASLAHAG